MIEQTNSDYVIKTRFIDIRVRSGEILVTRLFSSVIHQPLVILININGEIKSCSPKNIKEIKNSLRFVTDEGVSGKIKASAFNDIHFELNHSSAKIGIMMPVHDTVCYFSDIIKPINKHYTTSAIYLNTTNDPTYYNLPFPVFHITEHDNSLSLSFDPKSPVEMNYFLHENKPYINFLSENHMNVEFQNFFTKREAISMYYNKYGYVAPKPITNCLNICNMQQLLFTNSKIEVPTLNRHIFQTAKEIQSMLPPNNCLIGSAAMALHGFKLFPQDLDLAVESIEQAKNCLSNFNIHCSTSKWKNCSFRIIKDDIQVDISEIDIDWSITEHINDIRVLNKKELLLMKLIGEFERSVMNPNYDQFMVKNHHDIFLLLNNSKYVYSFFRDFMDATKEFDHLYSMLKNAKWEPVRIKPLFPIQVNVFSTVSHIILPVLNPGSDTSTIIQIEQSIKNAIYHGIDGNIIHCNTSSSDGWSSINTPPIHLFGLIQCEK